jgi:hypothetical protein
MLELIFTWQVFWLSSWVVFLFVSIHEEYVYRPYVATSLLLLSFWYWSWLPTWEIISSYNWFVIISVYLCAGAGWLVFKWIRFYQYVYDNLNPTLSKMVTRCEDNGIYINELKLMNKLETPYTYNDNAQYNDTELTLWNSLRDKWSGTKRIVIGHSDKKIPLKSLEFKEKLIMWGMWWPISFIETFFSDFIYNLWNFIYDLMGGFLDKLSTGGSDRLTTQGKNNEGS